VCNPVSLTFVMARLRAAERTTSSARVDGRCEAEVNKAHDSRPARRNCVAFKSTVNATKSRNATFAKRALLCPRRRRRTITWLVGRATTSKMLNLGHGLAASRVAFAISRCELSARRFHLQPRGSAKVSSGLRARWKGRAGLAVGIAYTVPLTEDDL
jgi:hypothetical protein